MFKRSTFLLGLHLLEKTNKSTVIKLSTNNINVWSGVWTNTELCSTRTPSKKLQKFDCPRIQSVHTSQSCSCDGAEEKPQKENRDPTKDRSKVIPFETSQRYMESEAYKTTYGDEPVWVKYRRNFKGQFPSKKTRLTCIKDAQIISGNPCPICRDEFLVVDFRNVGLLKQFVSPYTDQVLPWSKTNVCQTQQMRLEVAIEKARMHGLMTFYVPFRKYDYKDYNDPKAE